MASSVVAKEQTMRRKNLRGDQEVVGAVVSIPLRSWARWTGLKISGFERFWRVVSSVAGLGSWGEASDLR